MLGFPEPSKYGLLLYSSFASLGFPTLPITEPSFNLALYSTVITLSNLTLAPVIFFKSANSTSNVQLSVLLSVTTL